MKQRNRSLIVLYLYWMTLLIWQNIRSVGNRSGTDVAIKLLLVFALSICFLMESRVIGIRPFLVALIFGALTAAPFFVSGTFSVSILIYYLFPVLLFVLTYVVGGQFQVSKQQLMFFLRCIVVSVTYIVVYGLLFCWEQYEQAISAKYGYGYELTSFLTSNYEYGLYLAFGIMSAILLLELDSERRKVHIFYWLCVVAFAITLVLTFSRTSIIAFLVMLSVYLMSYRKSRVSRRILMLCIIGFLLLVALPPLQNYFIKVVFKDNATSDRPELIVAGLRIFSNYSVYEKWFGSLSANAMVKNLTEHSNLHNGYLQMLLTNGFKGFIFLAGLILEMLHTNRRALKRRSVEEKRLIKTFQGFLMAGCVFMFTTTSTLMYSSIDSYFLTMFVILVPKYVRNAIRCDMFGE